MLRIAWGALNTSEGHGYGHVSTQLPIALTSAGATIVDSYDPAWDVAVVVSTPASWLTDRNGYREGVILHTMYEATPLPPHWVNNINRFEAVWVPSQWVKDLFLDQGVTRPILVAGYGIDPNLWRSHDRHGRTGPLKVVIWGDSLFSRKRVWDAIEAFRLADIPDATLEVKLSGLLDLGMMGVLDSGAGTNTLPVNHIRIIAERWSHERLVNWLHEADIGIYLSGGEGFGLMPLQMMATGLPVICPVHTGMAAYLDDATSLFVPSLLGPAFEVYDHPAHHFVPDVDAAAHQLCWAAEHREQAYMIGDRASIRARRFTWDKAGVDALSVLHSYYHQPHNG